MKILLFLSAAVLLAAPARAQLPVSGRPVPGMARFDTIMTDFMNANGITAGVLGISRGGRIEYLRSFGWLTRKTSAPGSADVALPENALMRTASVVKPVTAAAVRQLDTENGFGATGLNSRAFTGLAAGKTGLLSVTPSPSLGDTRHADVTLAHLLLHQGGFDRRTNPPGDVMFRSRTVAGALSVNSPPSNTDTMRYMLGRTLQWAPGTVSNLNAPAGTDAYSNYGYMVLGEVLQSRAPGGYFGFVHSRLLNPLWVPSTEFALARTFVPDRSRREPEYIAFDSSSPNVFDNTEPIEDVPTPDGGYAIEQMMAHGGVVASAQAMIHFGNNYHLWYQNDRVGRRITTADPMLNAGHSGRLDGTETLLQQRSDGVVYYFALNRTDFGTPGYAGNLANLINAELNKATPAFTWPGTAADGIWMTVGTEELSSGPGGYHSPFQGFYSTIVRVAESSRLRIKPGSQVWTGTIAKRLQMDAPEGDVHIGP